MEDLYIFKIGGRLIDDSDELQLFLKAYAGCAGKKILIHGGGLIADEFAGKLGLDIQMHEGRRITSKAMRDLITMVYGGLLNKQIVARLQAFGCDAIGLTGADGALLKAKKRAALPIDYGLVGDIYEVRRELLDNLLLLGFNPVIAPLSLQSNGEILNSNADGVASKIAEAFAAEYKTHLFYSVDQAGVLLDIKKPESLLETLDLKHYLQLKTNLVINRGMLPKLDSCFKAKAQGVQTILIARYQEIMALIAGTEFKGTLIL